MYRNLSSRVALPSLPLDFVLPDDSPFLRLDAALGLVLPELSLRGRRRLWSWCRIGVNGTLRPPGFMLRGGDADRVELRRAPDAAGWAVTGRDDAGQAETVPLLLAVNRDFAALRKPEGLHSAHIAGGAEPSLERLLPALWPDLWKQWAKAQAAGSDSPVRPEVPSLLTRLDKGSSGIVLAALRPDAAERFRREERCGMVRKSYFALVRGLLAEPLQLRLRLMTDNRERTLVREEEEEDATRHTLVAPLGPVSPPGAPCGSEAVSLVRVRIRRGARHQIRAHLAHAGFPLLGECLYAPPLPGVSRLYLHHAALRLPGFAVTCRPSWGL